MKLALMQPYFFPYIGYYTLINYVDKFIFFDTPQYIRRGWINRNRILKMDNTPDYFTVPIQKCSRETPIYKVKINQEFPWRERIYGQFTAYKRRAPYYNAVMKLLRDTLEGAEMISELSIKSIINSCKYIGIEADFDILSTMHLDITDVNEADEWALEITKAMGYETYVNPPGGKSFYNRKKYEQVNIELQFLEAELKPYDQRNGKFEAGLSILDAMMFLSPSEMKDLLKEYVIT